jgi:histone H3/H4
MASSASDGVVALRFAVAHRLSERAKAAGIRISADGLVAATALFDGFLRVGSEDLVSFCKHAKRSTVTPDDVQLLFRHSPQASAALAAAVAAHEAKKAAKKSRPQQAAPAAAASGASAAGDDFDEADLLSLV